jgi:glycosyltransferase involved in cell wall biosynthesis
MVRQVRSEAKQRARSFAIVANGFADGPAQALRDHLVAKRTTVVAVSHPLSPEDGTRHHVARYVSGDLADEREIDVPLRPPLSYLADPLVPLRIRRVDVWFGFNPLACARGLVARRTSSAGTVVLWSPDFVPDRFGAGTLSTRAYDYLDRLCCTKADARVELTRVARDARDRRHRLAAGGPPVHVVPMGAWLDRTPVTRDDGWSSRRLVFLAHLVRRQGPDAFLETVACLRAAGEDGTAADVVGTGPLEAKLRAQARTLGIDDVVRFHGFVADHREVERILAGASLAVAPYRPGEGTFTAFADPGKIKAYLAAGLPLLLTDVPPNADELAREAGAEIVPFAPDAIAEAARRLLSSPDDWRARRALALAYVRRFDWPVLLDGLLDRLGVSIA